MKYITLTNSQTAAITIQGYFLDATNFVLLSCSNNTVFPYITAVNLFKNKQDLSTAFPEASGYPWTNFIQLNFNQMIVNVYALTPNFEYDIVIGNSAGYTKLSDEGYLVYSTP